ncbi:MAG TPA: SDR family oxidoreductase [Anaerolineaceae bacterium]|nr:SDR family oxidoreductase [Anaerolineaceae bacterium]
MIEQSQAGKTQSPSLQQKRIVISGGTTGIGRAIAMLLASQGARVLIFGRHKPELDDAINAVRQAGGGEVFGLTADTSRKEDIEQVFAMADRELGGVDILINSAALPAQSIVDTSYEEQQYVVGTNLIGYMAMAQQAIQRMKPKGSGHIVFVGSMSADVREKGNSLYVATKGGIQALAEALRKEVNEAGIKVSLIEPGEVGSDMNQLSPPEQREKQAELAQLKAEDIAECVLFCLNQPPRVDIIDLQVRPHKQLI